MGPVITESVTEILCPRTPNPPARLTYMVIPVKLPGSPSITMEKPGMVYL